MAPHRYLDYVPVQNLLLVVNTRRAKPTWFGQENRDGFRRVCLSFWDSGVYVLKHDRETPAV